MTQAAILAASGSPGTTTGFKNRIINGNFTIDQRNAGASVTTSTNYVYPVDRFRVGYGSGGAITAQQSTTVPSSGGFINSLYCTPSTTDNLADSGDFYAVAQTIEGYNIADLSWGTSSAKPVTISFWVRSSITGTYSVTVTNNAGNRCYPATYTISSANTWEQKSVTIAGDTSGTWLTNNGLGMFVAWNLGGGSGYAAGTANAWNAGAYQMTSSQTPWISTSGATFYLTGCQLEVGTTATNFDFRSIGTELALCQRYYWQTPTSDLYHARSASGIAYNTTGIEGVNFSMPVTMRTTPSFSLANAGFYSPYVGRVPNSGTVGVYQGSTDSLYLNNANNGSGFGANYNYFISSTSTTSAKFNAEI